MINLQQELQNFLPINLESLLQRNPSIPDNIRNSVILYNKSLESLRTGSEDIAVIELKKAVAMNPDFHEAMNLLGVCYSSMDDNTKAIEIFEKVVKAENNSVKALKYMNVLNMGDPGISTAKEKKKRTRIDSEPKPLKDSKGLFSTMKGIRVDDKSGLVKLLTGFAAGILVAALIAIPIFLAYAGASPEDGLKDSEDDNKTVTDTIDPYKPKYESLNKDFLQLQEQFTLANKEIDYYRNATRLYTIDGLVYSKNYEAAADLLVELKSIQFRDPEKDKYTTLHAAVIPKALTAVYNDGNRFFNLKNYQEAVSKLNKIPTYTDDWKYMDSALYLIGKSYALLNDARNAVAAFQKVVDMYPRSKYAQWSASRINELTAVP